jgi:hypothetical protein
MRLTLASALVLAGCAKAPEAAKPRLTHQTCEEVGSGDDVAKAIQAVAAASRAGVEGDYKTYLLANGNKDQVISHGDPVVGLDRVAAELLSTAHFCYGQEIEVEAPVAEDELEIEAPVADTGSAPAEPIEAKALSLAIAFPTVSAYPNAAAMVHSNASYGGDTCLLAANMVAAHVQFYYDKTLHEFADEQSGRDLDKPGYEKRDASEFGESTWTSSDGDWRLVYGALVYQHCKGNSEVLPKLASDDSSASSEATYSGATKFELPNRYPECKEGRVSYTEAQACVVMMNDREGPSGNRYSLPDDSMRLDLYAFCAVSEHQAVAACDESFSAVVADGEVAVFWPNSKTFKYEAMGDVRASYFVVQVEAATIPPDAPGRYLERGSDMSLAEASASRKALFKQRRADSGGNASKLTDNWEWPTIDQFERFRNEFRASERVPDGRYYWTLSTDGEKQYVFFIAEDRANDRIDLVSKTSDLRARTVYLVTEKD